jgi:anti-sigma regulatory factor (Ser/Thr protein kinase)
VPVVITPSSTADSFGYLAHARVRAFPASGHPDRTGERKWGGDELSMEMTGIGADEPSVTRRDRVTLASNQLELERLKRWLRQWTYENALPAHLSFAVSVCVEQAVTNVVVACEAGGDEAEIAVEIARNAVTLVVQVEDTGPPLAHGAGDAKVSSLERARMGDLGMRLMRSLASGIEYECSGDRNRLTLRFLQPEPASMMTG